jgi:hypothetical protein
VMMMISFKSTFIAFNIIVRIYTVKKYMIIIK